MSIEIEGVRYGYTQPICAQCFLFFVGEPYRVRMIDDEERRCCACARATSEGIYWRVDPRTVRYPSPDED